MDWPLTRTATALLFGLLVVSACGGSTTSTTVHLSEQERFERDKAAILDLFESANRSWGNTEEGARYWVDHNHPDLGYDVSDYCFDGVPVHGYSESWRVDPESIRRSDGWTLGANDQKKPSPIDGTTPRGTLYVLETRLRTRWLGGERDRGIEAHAAVINGHAYWFVPPPPSCD